jgi:hypothetical protein
MKLAMRPFIFIWACCIMGSLLVLPYSHFLGLIPHVSPAILLSVVVQSIVLYGVICWLCYLFVRKVDLQPFLIRRPLKQIIYPGILTGLVVGLTIFALERSIFSESILANSVVRPPFWSGVLASFYGAFNEEVLSRLFLLTVVYLLLCKIVKHPQRSRNYLLASAILISSLAFAAGHLPALFKITGANAEIFRVFLLNGTAGIAFGWLYCTRGFWAAALAHFSADIIIHAILV